MDELERVAEEDLVGQIDIYIDPPNDGQNSESDSGDEGCNDPDRLNRAQLQAPAELVINRRQRVSESEEEENEDEPAGPSTSQSPKRRRLCKKKPAKPTRKWVKKLFVPKSKQWIQPPPHSVLSLSADSDPIDFFQLFIGDDVIIHLVRHTVIYAAQKNNFNFSLSLEEMYVFIGILILSGYVPLPRRRMFWEVNEDTHNVLIAKSMRRQKFEEIFRYFHVVDNDNLIPRDKMAKVRPFFDMMNEKFLRYAPIEQNISIDESMIPYFGRHGCKQHIKGKPIRFGFKCWVCATRLGYCLHAELYQGRQEVREIGLGESVVTKLCDNVLREYPDAAFSVYCDNFFTNPQLLENMQKKGFSVTGTVRSNRTDKCPLMDEKIIKKKDRGYYDYRADERANIIAVRWNDNSVVTVLSSKYGAEPLHEVSRYSAAEKRRISVQQPDLIDKYNRYMGGVDRLDANVGTYRIAIRGKKWYMPILLWLVDVAVNNAILLAKSLGSSVDTLDFRRSISRTLLLRYGMPRNKPGPSNPSTSRQIPSAVRTFAADHMIITQQRRRRCAVCKNKTTKACKKCDIGLHDKCFATFHDKL